MLTDLSRASVGGGQLLSERSKHCGVWTVARLTARADHND